VNRRLNGYLGYPSGHTVSTASAWTVAMLGSAAGARIGRRVLALLAWVLVTGAVMMGLVGMDYHYPTDAVGGLCVALGVVLPGAALTDVLAARRTRRASLDHVLG
jgi:undecaprenyl-diphosphatase